MALTSVWTLVVRTCGNAVRWLLARLVAGWRWSRGRSANEQLLVALAVAVAGAAAVHVALRPVDVSVDEDGEALARVVHSECGSCSRQQQLHIAWATRNLAQHRKQSIADMVCSPCGRQQRGRPVSSRLAANDADRALAAYVLGAPALADPTDGATHFVNPRLQDYLAANSDRPGYRGKPYSAVRERWQKVYGWEPYYRLGPDLELWGPRRKSRR